ncbi:hypothetical protein N9917_05145, partial [Deltaproteobacteria bacterium]|nr:hypothetical protein [Deltaproteobacteria bacterium]
LMSDRGVPSGFVKNQARHDPGSDYTLGATPNAFGLKKNTAMVAGWPVVVEYTNTAVPGVNGILLDVAQVFGGAPPDIKRTDFVFLEVWQALVSDSSNATGTITVLPALPAPTDTILIGGLPLTATAGAPVVDEFLIGANEALTAANIASAINNVANSFDTIVSAQANGTIVTVRSVVSGTAGNAIGFVSASAGLSLSGAGTLLGGIDEVGKPTQDTLYRHGNVEAPAPVNLPDDIADPVIGTETAKRVQVQYRIRHTGQSEAVSFKSEPDGFSNPSVLAQGNTSAPVAGYPFVKADNATILSNSDATLYGYKDAGLWISGDGTSTAAAALGSLDGFVYAIPICFVFRRNDAYNAGAGAGWDPLSNTNGALPSTHGVFANPAVGVIPVNTSDRPDGAFHDIITDDDIQDLRYHVSGAGIDLVAELQFQIQSLLDGSNRTWAIDAADKNTLGAGSGDVSTRPLVCNQIGRDAGHGGSAPDSGSTTRGDTIRNYDHVARRFADQPVNEIVVFSVVPGQDAVSQPGRFVTRAGYAGAYGGWAEDDEINIDLGILNATTPGDFDYAKATFFGAASISDFMPPGTTIVDVRSIRHDEGNYAVAINPQMQAKLIDGLGTDHIKLVLDRNDILVDNGDPGVVVHRMVGDSGAGDVGSTRRIFVELEISYPLGSGTTDTPDEQVVP